MKANLPRRSHDAATWRPARGGIGKGFDSWFTAEPMPGASGSNGYYRGAHDIWTIDYPSLGSAPNPITFNAARTAAHELGHGLNLNHQNCGLSCPCEASQGLDCDDLLIELALERIEDARDRMRDPHRDAS